LIAQSLPLDTKNKAGKTAAQLAAGTPLADLFAVRSPLATVNLPESNLSPADRVEAVYPHQAVYPGVLSVPAKARLALAPGGDPAWLAQGWVYVQYLGQTGYVPASYCQPLPATCLIEDTLEVDAATLPLMSAAKTSAEPVETQLQTLAQEQVVLSALTSEQTHQRWQAEMLQLEQAIIAHAR
jgi:hypothetical protein